MKKIILAISLMLSIIDNPLVFAQENSEDVAVTDEFQTSYFESLKQKAI